MVHSGTEEVKHYMEALARVKDRDVMVAAELMDSLERPVSLVLAMAEAEDAVPMVAE